jgi:nucleoside-diphosphate-sugar epimerase
MPRSVKPLSIRLENPIAPQLAALDLLGNSVIHLAGVVGAHNIQNVTYSAKINIDKTLELAEALLESGIKKFVFASSSHVYSETTSRVDEASPCEPTTEYGRQKLEAESGLIEIFAKQPERLVIARIFSILDLQMPEYSLGGVLERIISRTENVKVHFSDDVRDFLDRSQVAEALVALAENLTNNVIYNICSGNPMTIKEALLDYVQSRGICLGDVEFLPGHSAKPFLVGDNSRIKSEYPGLGLA